MTEVSLVILMLGTLISGIQQIGESTSAAIARISPDYTGVWTDVRCGLFHLSPGPTSLLRPPTCSACKSSVLLLLTQALPGPPDEGAPHGLGGGGDMEREEGGGL